MAAPSIQKAPSASPAITFTLTFSLVEVANSGHRMEATLAYHGRKLVCLADPDFGMIRESGSQYKCQFSEDPAPGSLWAWVKPVWEEKVIRIDSKPKKVATEPVVEEVGLAPTSHLKSEQNTADPAVDRVVKALEVALVAKPEEKSVEKKKRPRKEKAVRPVTVVTPVIQPRPPVTAVEKGLPKWKAKTLRNAQLLANN